MIAAARNSLPQHKTLVIAEKPSVAADIAKALGGFTKHGNVHESATMLIAAAAGHLLTASLPKTWGLEDLPLDILEYLCLAFLPPAAFAALLATSPALRCALQPSEACWKRVAADVFGADAAAKHGPLSTTELAAAGRAVIVTGGGVDPLADLPPARRDWPSPRR